MSNKLNMNIAVVSNITVEPFFSIFLKEDFLKNGFNANVEFFLYDEYLSEDYSGKLIKADQIIIWLNMDCLYPNLINDLISEKVSVKTIEQDIQNKFQRLYTALKQKSRAVILWMGTEDYCYYPYAYTLGHSLPNRALIDCVNITLNTMLDEADKYIDLKSIIAKVGIENSFDTKSKYRWNIPYSRRLLSEIAQEVHKQYLNRSGITKKCVVLDCDNVLWGGILSEDGIEHIHLGGSGLGRSYQDFQRYILNLYYHGVIIAICSKNDKSDVLRMFREHTEMILREEHIACFCANWDNKPDNIKTISKALNIGLDSMVFIDDSNFEIQSVKALLPEVTAIKYHRDYIYEQLSCFNLRSDVNVEAVRQRNLTYQTNELRKNLKLEVSSFDEYLNALEIKVDIHKALPIELSRIAELTQRTNKCTNGRRYTVEQLKEMLGNGYELYSVYLSDKFSDLGLVGAIGTDGNVLDLFSLSCRALGRNVEEIMIGFISEKNVEKIYYDLTGQNHELHLKINNLMNIPKELSFATR